MHRYVRCECGNVVRYRGPVSLAKCPRCEEWLWKGEPVRKEDWLNAHGILTAGYGKRDFYEGIDI